MKNVHKIAVLSFFLIAFLVPDISNPVHAETPANWIRDYYSGDCSTGASSQGGTLLVRFDSIPDGTNRKYLAYFGDCSSGQWRYFIDDYTPIATDQGAIDGAYAYDPTNLPTWSASVAPDGGLDWPCGTWSIFSVSCGGGGGGDTPTTTPVMPVGAIWAMSALSIFTLIEFVYFAIFFMMMYAIAWGIIQVFRPIFRIITYGD